MQLPKIPLQAKDTNEDTDPTKKPRPKTIGELMRERSVTPDQVESWMRLNQLMQKKEPKGNGKKKNGEAKREESLEERQDAVLKQYGDDGLTGEDLLDAMAGDSRIAPSNDPRQMRSAAIKTMKRHGYNIEEEMGIVFVQEPEEK